jgi:FkbM family methyltransferase
MLYPRLAFLIIPYTRLELPGWNYLFELSKVGGIPNYSLWKAAPTKTIRGKWHGYLMKLDLSDWSERYTYFLGRYHELGLQLLMNQVLSAGDCFVDIGANMGLLTLHSAMLVTNSGCVHSFEPNPKCCRRIRELLEINHIKHVQLHEVGLSDQAETLTLSVIADHTGMGTLASPQDNYKELTSETFEVPVLIGDDVMMQNSTPVKLIKIDVEGFELRVLRGLQRTLETWFPIVVTEVIEEWLGRAGTSRRELCQFMKPFGYLPYGLTTQRRLFRHHLTLVPIDDAENANFTDFLWLHPNSRGFEALKPFITSHN